MAESAPMTRKSAEASPSAKGINGHPLSKDDLPPPNTRRWVVRRKAEVVIAVRTGVISMQEACERYQLSVEELLSWQKMIDKHGVPGLRTTRLQHYRENSDRS